MVIMNDKKYISNMSKIIDISESVIDVINILLNKQAENIYVNNAR